MSHDAAPDAGTRRTNRILYVLAHRDGTETTHDGGIITRADLPPRGAGRWIDGIDCRIVREAYTPHLAYTWTCWCREHV